MEGGEITGNDLGCEMLSLAIQLHRKPVTKDVLGFLELHGSHDPLRNMDTICHLTEGGELCFFFTITFALVKQVECCGMVFIFYRTSVHTNDIFL